MQNVAKLLRLSICKRNYSSSIKHTNDGPVSLVCQILLHYKSFADVSKKIGHKPSGGRIVKSYKTSGFKMLSCWISSSNWNRLGILNGTETLLFGQF